MLNPVQLLTVDELRRRYDHADGQGRSGSLNPDNVPEQFWPLIPYAEFCGVRDSGDRMRLVENAPQELRQNLKAVVAANENALQEWLAGDAADATPTDEYIALCTLIMASDFI